MSIKNCVKRGHVGVTILSSNDWQRDGEPKARAVDHDSAPHLEIVTERVIPSWCRPIKVTPFFSLLIMVSCKFFSSQ